VHLCTKGPCQQEMTTNRSAEKGCGSVKRARPGTCRPGDSTRISSSTGAGATEISAGKRQRPPMGTAELVSAAGGASVGLLRAVLAALLLLVPHTRVTTISP
jgi:hypothetical protein